MNFRQNLMRLRHWFATFGTHRDSDGKSADPYGFDKRLSESRMFLSFLKPSSLKANWSTAAPFGILPENDSPENRAKISNQFIFVVEELKSSEVTMDPKEFNRVRSLIKGSLQECRYKIKDISCLSNEDKLSNFTYNALLLALDENKIDHVQNLCDVLKKTHNDTLVEDTVGLIEKYLNDPLRFSPVENISLMNEALKAINKKTTSTATDKSKKRGLRIKVDFAGGVKPPEKTNLGHNVEEKVQLHDSKSSYNGDGINLNNKRKSP